MISNIYILCQQIVISLKINLVKYSSISSNNLISIIAFFSDIKKFKFYYFSLANSIKVYNFNDYESITTGFGYVSTDVTYQRVRKVRKNLV